jgi:raffinose/stachyose/melibiose transport system substrate-binding protein
MKRTILVAASLAFVLLGAGAWADSRKSDLSGRILWITHHTDMVDNLFQGYIQKFNEQYPNIQVEIEGITDYATVMRTRMNTEDYGDVFSMIANPPVPSDFSKFYEPFGKRDVIEKTYKFLKPSSFDGVVYGISPNANVAGGILYNKQVFKDAGIKTPPKSIDDFYADLKLIQKKLPEVSAIYMNYPAKWTLNAWEGNILSVAGDPDYVNKMAHMDDPFSPGKPHYILYKVMYDVVKNKLCEKDPLTSDWELSKQLLADGKIGCMVLGSWAISQVKALAKDPENIGYMPFPYSIKSQLVAEVAADYQLAINVHGKNKAAARAFADFILNDSGFAVTTMSIPTKVGAAYPSVLDAFKTLGVSFIESKDPPKAEEGLTDKIDKEAEIGRWNEPWKQRIMESALGSSKESYDEIMKDLNAKWAKARKTLGVK